MKAHEYPSYLNMLLTPAWPGKFRNGRPGPGVPGPYNSQSTCSACPAAFTLL
jgi:hypothetical protein